MNIRTLSFDKYDIEIILVTLILSVVLLCNAILISTDILNMRKPLEIQIMLIYVLILLLIIKRNSIMALKSLFWITFGLFSFGNILAFYLGGEDYTEYLGAFGSFKWNADIIERVLLYYLIFMVVFSLFSIKREYTSTFSVAVTYNQSKKDLFYEIGSLLMIVSLPFALYVSFREIIASLTYGYESIYVAAVGLPAYIRIFRLTFMAGFYAVCAGSTNEKKYIMHGYVFLFYHLIGAFKGGRGELVVAVIFVFYFRYKLFGKKVKLKYVMLAFLLGIPILSAVTYIRSSGHVSFDFIGLYRSFLQEAGKSINITAMYQQNKIALSNNSYPYLIEPIIRIYLLLKYPFLAFSGQSDAVLNVRFNLSHQLSAHMDKITYLSGGGLGSSFIAELSEYGVIGIVIGAILLTLILRFIDKRMYTSRILRFFSCIIVTHMLLMPRAEYFLDTYNIMKYILAYLIISIFSKVALMYKSKANNILVNVK